jgi:hypothetical protein
MMSVDGFEELLERLRDEVLEEYPDISDNELHEKVRERLEDYDYDPILVDDVDDMDQGDIF